MQKLSVSGQTTVHAEKDDGTYQAVTDVPSTRFLDNGDGTVTDNMTGLMWIKSQGLAALRRNAKK